ncbi:hypothetical protein GGD55_003225 [Rhizobium giardinii]|uniref:Uncharacterized protein n=1 Tax=Rhizobium giardinii TaxID=56731 RepID=A0A7W8UD30_9HYPH|nr:hypothetical protein [Rhizobium giardinii]
MAYAAASYSNFSVCKMRFAVGGHERRGRLPISRLEGKMSARLTEGGESHGRRHGGGNTSVH